MNHKLSNQKKTLEGHDGINDAPVLALSDIGIDPGGYICEGFNEQRLSKIFVYKQPLLLLY